MIKNTYKNTYKKLPALMLLVVVALCICGAASSYSYGAEPAGEKVTVHYHKNASGTEVFTFGSIVPGDLFTAINTRSAGFYLDEYELRAWNTEPDGSGTDYFPGFRYVINEEMDLYAQWRYLGSAYYDIAYHGNTGSGGYVQGGCIPNQMYKVIDPSDYGITKEYYRFVEWNTSPDGNGTGYKLGEQVRASQPMLNLYAIWEYNSTQYFTVLYDSSGGYGSHMDEAILAGETYVIKDTAQTGISLGPLRLNGWKDSNGILYQPGDEIVVNEIDAVANGVLILYADWTF